MPNLDDIPIFVLEEIAFHVALSSFLGPPKDLPSLLGVSRRIYNTLSIENTPHLYARIFQAKFDIAAVCRRWDNDMTVVTEQASELILRCEALKRLCSGNYTRYPNCEQLRVDLWLSYIMFLENDGRNARQLVRYAKIDTFALEFVRLGGRLHDGVADNQGWTLNNEINSLALWLFWFTDFERIPNESPAERDAIIDALSPIYAGSFKYSHAYMPLTYFLIPPVNPPPVPAAPLSILPFSACPIPPSCTIPSYFGCEITLACPLLVPPVILSFISRQEVPYNALFGQNNNAPRRSAAPATRAEARRTGWTGATLEDYLTFGRLYTVREEWMRDGRSAAYDQDWYRLRTCYDPWDRVAYRDRVYKPGMLNGKWDGKWLMIPPNEFHTLLTEAQAGIPFPQDFRWAHHQFPMQFRIREHHQCNPDAVLGFDDNGPGALCAWLPPGTRFVERDGMLRVLDGNTPITSYRTYDPFLQKKDDGRDVDMKHRGPYGDGVYDILLTAETDPVFGEAWGHNAFRGRVRDWDGLIVLERMSVGNQGRWIFQGYLHGQQNLVGRWRETATQFDAPGWEGAWSMARCN